MKIEGMKKLTLDKLRDMDGKPALLVLLNDDKFQEWVIVNAKYNYCEGLHYIIDFKDIGEVWEAYGYELLLIDRSAWEPCEHCKPSKGALDRWGPHQFQIDDVAIYYYDVDDGWEGEEINFCPWCCRPLTDAAWKMLERRLSEREQQ